MRTDTQTVKTSQFVGEGFDIAPFFPQSLDGQPQSVAGLGRQAPEKSQNLVLDAHRNHSLSRAERP
jgi:hypothetical protein